MFIDEPLFYARALNDGDEIVLTGDEARHITVQRLRVGDAIAVFDGRGEVARGVVRAFARREVRVQIAQRHREPSVYPQIDLYTAVPKGERFAVLLDMTTQLGVSRVIPVHWQRSVADRGARVNERWQRICVEACKQSRRLHVPEVAAAVPFEQAARQAFDVGASLLVAHLHEDARPLLGLELPVIDRMALFVGPEGGLTGAETERLREAGAKFVRLGSDVLRIETAAVAFVAVTRAVVAARRQSG